MLTIMLSLTAHGARMQTEQRQMLETLKRDAVSIGHGPREAYVFIDPKCHRSAEFLEAILDSETLRNTFHYYLFVYDMPQVDSHRVVSAVYSAPDPLEALKTYMLKRKKVGLKTGAESESVRHRIERIEAAVQLIGIDHTPYLLIDR